ncbi:MAG: mechanosensitive ion channel family protein [Euryarchaeota archaeon]|nr:mechanosensitive ion channel family protein [Euryarchaeota archaeon]
MIVLQALPAALPAWAVLLVIAAVALATGFLFEALVIRFLRRLVKNSTGEMDDFVLKAMHPALLVFVFVAVLLYGILEFAETFDATTRRRIGDFGFAIVAFLFALFVARLLQGALSYRARTNARWQPVAMLGGRLGAAAIYAIAFMVILDHYNVEISPLVASLGIGAIAVGLALQDTLTNVFAGIWMQTGNYFKPGHFIRVEDANIEGYVAELGWRTTKIRTLPNNIVVIPNSKLSQSVVTDYYLPSTRMSLLISVSTQYDEDPDRVERILVEEALAAAAETPGLLKDPEPFVRLIPGFGEYALQYTLIVQVREFTDQYLAQHNIRKRLLRRFKQEGIRIPYPTRENIQRAGPPVEAADATDT